MSQNDMVIANADGATVRADLSAALQALVGQNSGATAPSTTYPFMWWFDTANSLLKIRNSADSAWVTVASLSGTTWKPYIEGSAVDAVFAQLVQAFEDLASASTTSIGGTTSQNVRVTGTTTITSLGTVAAGTFRRLRFADALTLTHNASSLILPGGANITTAANDTGTFISLGSGNWLCLSYKRASGQPIAAVAGVLAAGGTLVLSSGTGGTLTDLGGVSNPDVVEIDLTDISCDAADNLEVTIGDSGGAETSGYDAGSAPAGVGIGGVITSSSAFVLEVAGAARLTHVQIRLRHQGGNKWLFTAHGGRTQSSSAGLLGWGVKTLSGTLDRVAVGWSSTGNFDGTGGKASLWAGEYA